MIITDKETTSRGKPALNQESMNGDVLNMAKFNALPSPVTARIVGGDEHWIETLDVQTGAMRVCVNGMIDLTEFAMVLNLIDANNVEHDPDDFWLEEAA